MKIWVRHIAILALIPLFTACAATQYSHPIKKTADFYDDLKVCEMQADREPDLKAKAREKAIDQCLVHFGWRERNQTCYSSSSRVPASEPCRK